jgi:hypothetical protein
MISWYIISLRRNMQHIWSLCCKVQRKQVICQLSKKQVCKSKDGFLGTCVVLGPNPKKIESIMEWQNQVSTNRLFLGLTNFYKKFIKDFSTLAKPLTNHLKKRGFVQVGGWTTKCFRLVKRGVVISTNWRTPKLLEKLKCEFENGNNGRRRNWGTFLNL